MQQGLEHGSVGVLPASDLNGRSCVDQRAVSHGEGCKKGCISFSTECAWNVVWGPWQGVVGPHVGGRC